MKNPQCTNRKRVIAGEFLSCGELAHLCGVTSSTIRKRVTRGFYQNTRDENDKRGFPGKGKPHRININDPAISEDVRNRWRNIQEHTFGLTAQRDDLLLKELREMRTTLNLLLELAVKDRQR